MSGSENSYGDDEQGGQGSLPRSKPGDQTALLGVIIAAALAVFVVPGEWDWSSCALGVTLLLILFAYDRESDIAWPNLFAFGAVFGMCCLLATGVFLEQILEFTGQPLPEPNHYVAIIEEHKHCAVSTEDRSRLGESGTALAWLEFGLIGTLIGGFKRGKYKLPKWKILILMSNWLDMVINRKL